MMGELPDQVRIAVRLVGSKDLDYIAEPLAEVVSVDKRYAVLLEAQVETAIAQTIVVTLLPHSIPLLKEVETVLFDHVLGRVLDVFARMPGRKHIFTHEFKVDRTNGIVDGKLLMSSENVELMREAIKTGKEEFDKALELMQNDPAPPSHYVVYGIEFDEGSVSFKIRRKDVTAGELTEYDEENGTWQIPPT